VEAASQDISIWARVNELLLPAAGALFTNAVYRTMCGPMVLVFLTAGKPVYIGWSKAGLGFCTGQGKYPVKHCDEVMVYPTATYEDARELHSKLIDLFSPKYNPNAHRFSERATKRLAEHFRG
jgi:hypothetical protein